MLEELDNIPWSEYRHAYGPAADVPRLLRYVAEGGEIGKQAARELLGTIWHQGTVYDATPLAVPFLGELASSERVDPDIRELLLLLILLIGRGRGYWQAHAPQQSPARSLPEDLAEQLQAEASWVEACRDSVEDVASQLLDQIPASPDRLWLATAVLVAVAGDRRMAAIDEVVAEANHRLDRFGGLGLLTVSDLVRTNKTSDRHVEELASLDEDLADFVAYERAEGKLAVTLDSHFVDLLLERIHITQGRESKAQT